MSSWVYKGNTVGGGRRNRRRGKAIVMDKKTMAEMVRSKISPTASRADADYYSEILDDDILNQLAVSRPGSRYQWVIDRAVAGSTHDVQISRSEAGKGAVVYEVTSATDMDRYITISMTIQRHSRARIRLLHDIAQAFGLLNDVVDAALGPEAGRPGAKRPHLVIEETDRTLEELFANILTTATVQRLSRGQEVAEDSADYAIIQTWADSVASFLSRVAIARSERAVPARSRRASGRRTLDAELARSAVEKAGVSLRDRLGELVPDAGDIRSIRESVRRRLS